MRRLVALVLVVTGLALVTGCADPYASELDLVAYGNVASDGTIRNGSGNFIITYQSAGYYLLTIDPPVSILYDTDIVVVNPIGYSNDNYAIWSTYADGSVIGISTFNSSGVKEDCGFSFLVYKL